MRDVAQNIQRQVTDVALGSLFEGAHMLGMMSAGVEHDRFDTHTVSNVAYGAHPDQVLDVIVPVGARGPLPVVMHVHGGAFTMLSKDSHHRIAQAFARRGYLVVNVGYRLAPDYMFPAAPADVAAAYRWVVDHSSEFGGDTSQLVLAGESAGANLVLGLAIAATTRRAELYARRVFETGVAPQAVVSFSGLLQLSDVDRFDGLKGLVATRELRRIRAAYLGGTVATPELADPLVLLESSPQFHRPFPAVFAPSGTADPLRDDSQRLSLALRRAGVHVDAPLYDGEPHSFHAFMWRENARRAWSDAFDFLDDVVEGSPRLAA